MAITTLHPESARTTWDEARATYEMARADALEDVESDDELMLLGGAQADASRALQLTPAPDMAALRYKMETFAAEDCFNLTPEYRDPLFAALIADVRRLGEA